MSVKISRHKTAIGRSALSLPAKLLFQSGLVNDSTYFLDFGCGRGDDVKFLSELGVPASGWDPYFSENDSNLKKSDVVNLGFVLNVIENKRERIDVLRKAFSLTKRCLSVAVMLHSQNDTTVSVPFNDGQLTARQTFQKYYDQKELEELLTENLQISPIAAAPGVFFIFKDEKLEQDFLLKRQLGIIQDYEPDKLLTKVNEKKELAEQILKLTERLKRYVLKFARKPQLDELPRNFLQQLEISDVTFRRIFAAASQLISEEELKEAIEEKKEQLLLFFSMHLFSTRPKYRSLSSGLQKDVRIHFSSMKALEAKSKDLLYSLGNEDLLYTDSENAEKEGLGICDDKKFIFSAKNLSKIPLRLRGVMSIAERLSGKINDIDIIKIHIESKKVSYLQVKDFSSSPIPRVLSRTIVDFRDNKIVNVDHTEKGKVKVIYLKSRLMSEKDPNFLKQKDFDDLLIRSFDFDFTGEGPKFDDFAKGLFDQKIVPPSYTR
jgi:DNA phosphorothioation-associated putative methyltransferase